MSYRGPLSKSDYPGITFTDSSLTKQSFKKDCDVNFIVSQHDKTGVISHINDSKPLYGDFSSIEDYHTACDQIYEAEALFDGLPATLRARFNNDPAKLVEFALNPENEAEMIELGLAPSIQKEPGKPESIKPQADKSISPSEGQTDKTLGNP